MQRTTSRAISCWVALALGVLGAGCGNTADTGDTGTTSGDPVGDAGPDVVDSGPHPHAFLTSTSYTGDLATQGGGTSGLDGGDKLCGQVAAAAGVTGTFKAWLSDASTNAIDRLDE